MSSCFLCDTSCNLTDTESHSVFTSDNEDQSYYMKFMPIMVGSTGRNGKDQQHDNNNKQNYVSYRVKKIEFRSSVREVNDTYADIWPYQSNYILIFKVPFREPVVNYYFTYMQNFMLYSEPESVLKYGIYKFRKFELKKSFIPEKYDLIVDKPFIVGPNDIVGVFYMFVSSCRISSSAKVWFDIV